jgi:hypothetical protein
MSEGNQMIVTGTTVSVTSQVWTIWNETYSSSTVITSMPYTTPTFSSSEIWGAWNVAHSSRVINTSAVPGRLPTEAERQAQAAERERWRVRDAEIKANEAKASERAEKLLQESLNGKQREELAAKGYFELDVISQKGTRRYRIHRKWSHSIHQVDPSNGQRLKTLCIHPREVVPIADSMLAQKLMLESGMEDELLRIANHS